MVGVINRAGYYVGESVPYTDKVSVLHNLPLGAKVRIVRNSSGAEVWVDCAVWKNKSVHVGSYTDEFTDYEIMRDCVERVLAKFGLRLYSILQ